MPVSARKINNARGTKKQKQPQQSARPEDANIYANIRYLIGLQIASRLVSFLINNWILRSLAKDSATRTQFALLNAKYDLLAGILVSLAREPIRNVVLQVKEEDQFCSLAWIIPPASAGICLVYWIVNPSMASMSIAALILESLTEPTSMCYAMIWNQPRKKALIEMTGLLVKSSVLLAYAKFPDLPAAVRSAHLAHSLCLLFLYTGIFKWPSFAVPKRSVAHQLVRNMIYALLRFALCPSEAVLAAAFCSSSEQATFSLVSNYGSMILRLLAQPINDASLQYFSQTNSHHYFGRTMKLLLYLSAALISFGAFFTDPLVHVLLGRHWAQEGVVAGALAWYCVHVAVQIIAGFGDSYIQATFSSELQKKLHYWSLVRSALQASLGFAGHRLFGLDGFIAANALCTSCHVMLCFSMLKFPKIPRPVFCSILVAFLVNFYIHLSYRNEWLMRIASGSALGLFILYTIYRWDRHSLHL